MREPWCVLEALLVAACVAVGALWLEIPDANAAEIAASAVLAVAGVAAVAWAQSSVLLLVRRRKGAQVAAWLGGLLLAGLGILYWLVTTFFAVGGMQDRARAEGWWAHPAIGAHVSVETLVSLEGAVWWLLRWALVAALLPVAMEGAATGMRGGWLIRAGGLLRQPLYWGVLLAAAAVGTVTTHGLLQLRPQLPVMGEIVLTVLKVLGMFAVDVGAACFALSLAGTYLRDAERARPEVPGVRPSSARHRRR